MRVTFELDPIESLQGWRTENQVSFDWFSLTAGNYDVTVDGESIFEKDGSGVDYYVARLWEDLLSLIPYILMPLPATVADKVNDLQRWQRWCEHLRELLDGSPEIQDWVENGVEWWLQHALTSGSLKGESIVYIWRFLDSIYLRTLSAPGFPSTIREYHVSVEQFKLAICRFNSELLDAVSSRIKQMEEAGKFELDFAALWREHSDRAIWYGLALEAGECWDGTRSEAISKLEAILPF